MILVPILVAAAFAAVAGAGALLPLLRGGAVALEPLADPLEDERLRRLRALKEIDRDRSAGLVSEQEYRGLRHEMELEAIVVLNDLGRRSETTPRVASSPNGSSRPGPASRARRVGAILLVGALVAATVPLLVVTVRKRPAPGLVAAPDRGGSISFFEQRVHQHPEDVAARLDLAQHLLDTRRFGRAADQYLSVLKLDAANAEASAKLGFLLYLSGAATQALRAEDAALQGDATYPEALYFKGLILLRGLHRPARAAVALRAYLAGAPFGSYRPEAQRLLAVANRKVAS